MTQQDIQTSEDAALWAMMAEEQKKPDSHVRQPRQAEEYDFTRPRRFSPRQFNKLTEFADLISRKLTASLSAMLRGAAPIDSLSVSEQYATHMTLPEKGYYVPLLLDGQCKGFLEFPANTAIAFINKLLGGIDGAPLDPDRKISSLEHDLLLDIAQKMVEAFCESAAEANGPKITREPQVTPIPPEVIPEEHINEFVRLTCRRSDQPDMHFTFALLSRLCEPIAGVKRPADMTVEDARLEMLAHLKEVRMAMKVQLDMLDVRLRDIASLAAGDVLILNTKINEPVDAIVSGKTIYRGVPAQHKGCCAIQVAQVREVD